ncbi:MAG: FkbM family methyltransferase [Chlamydiae bacterium]|nr:FkbM family methyltransferase [Chlamydiota bacterium]
MHTERPAPFVLLSTNHGTMIVNRNDYCENEGYVFGVGASLFLKSCYDPEEVALILHLLSECRLMNGDGVVAIDCGANIGVHTIEWSKHMHEWGVVFSFEAQERIFYALAGNITINNCLNAQAFNVAVGSKCEQIEIPEPNYLLPTSFGSLELKQHDRSEFIGQTFSSDSKKRTVNQVSIDSLGLGRIDFIKIDVEGMEKEVIDGALEAIHKFRPVIFLEYLKSDEQSLINTLAHLGYETFKVGINLLAQPIDKRLRSEFFQTFFSLTSS